MHALLIATVIAGTSVGHGEGAAKTPGTSWADVVPDGANLATDAKLSATRSNTGEVYRLTHVVDGKLTMNADIKVCESCWAGSNGDCRLDPIDFVIDLGEAKIIDRVVVATCHLKEQLRLTDFDVYGWAGTDWDGDHPLATVRASTQEVNACRFQPVKTSKVCLRLLDNTRPNHDFPHLSEVAILAADGEAKRQLKPTGLPPRVGELMTSAELKEEAERLRKLIEADPANDYLSPRLDVIAQRLKHQEEQKAWHQRLAEIDEETKELLAAGVPEWAAAQSEALRKYVLWTHWWIEHQQDNGEFGGTFNDDVELVCGWPLAWMAASDQKTFDSLKLLADGVWNWGPIAKHAYSTYTDVEHSAEEISYSQPRMMVLDPGEPKWLQRCARSGLAVRDLFMGTNGAGRLQFRSQWFGIKGDRPVVDAERAYDIPECAKALKPALYAALAGNDECTKLVLEYADTWLDAALKATDEKPAGLLPTRLDLKTGDPTGMQLTMPPMRAMHYHFIGCYLLTGDEKYLQPARALIEEYLVKRAVGDLPYTPSRDGREITACATQFGLLCSMWRRLTGDDSYDERFARWARRLRAAMRERYETFYYMNRASDDLWIPLPAQVGAFRMPRRAIGPELYAGWLATGDKDLLASACYNLSCVLTDQWDALTSWFFDKSETRVTSNDHSAHSIQCGASNLMMMYTGWSSPVEAQPPNNAVTWENTTPNFAALVLDADKTHLKALVCNLEADGREIGVRLLGLQPGRYTVTLGPDADGDDGMDRATRTQEVQVESGTRAALTLSSRAVQVVVVERTGG